VRLRPTWMTIYLGDETLSQLCAYCAEHRFDRFRLVADAHTYAALGQNVEQALRRQGWEVHTILLGGAEVVADEAAVMEVLAQSEADERVWLSVGSGTLTDLVRFVSHRTRLPFIALATAPSMDGYLSSGAPLVFHRVKQTFLARPPQAVFADLPTLCAAPPAMLAAGFGDMAGKVTALADWQLGQVLWDEPFDAAIAARMRAAWERCLAACVEIGRATPDGVRALMEGLLESGACLAAAGHSRPASGSEHHLSHFWEMRWLRQGRAALLHGAKVGVAAALMADQYAALRAVPAGEVKERLERGAGLSRQQQIERIQAEYGAGAANLLDEQAPLLELSPAQMDRIAVHWPEVQAIAASVPAAADIRGWLAAARAPTTPAELGLAPDEVASALALAHYLRPRFTVLKLMRVYMYQGNSFGLG
jgi:glycerol-1-phosphate dehydrogenase [NAD(P)+]